MTNNIQQQELWEQIQQYYLDKFGIEPNLVDVMSDIDTLRLCATGSANKSIATFLGLPQEGDVYQYQPIGNLLDKYFGFRGWQEDLHLNPLQYYRSLNSPDMEKFKYYVVLRYGIIDSLVIVHMYNASAIVDKLERLLDEKWV